MKPRTRATIIFLLCLSCVLTGALADSETALTLFRYTHGGYVVPQTYEIALLEDGYSLTENDGDPQPIDAVVVEEIMQIIEDYDVRAWDGFHESDPYVLDGEGFSLEIRFSDGASVDASGDNAFPTGYHGAINGIEAVLERVRMERIAGTYRYEGEGLGGDFTITLNADGTYSFTEGLLSSYAGGGTWYADVYGVYLDEKNGADIHLMFAFEADALVFLEAYADNFPGVKVPHEGRFVRE